MSSSSNQRKFHLRHPVVVDVGCNCRKPKLFGLFSSSPSPHSSKLKHADPFSTTVSSSNTTTTTFTSSSWDRSHATPFLEETSQPTLQEGTRTRRRRRRKKRENGRAARESLVVVKETLEPYSEFKESMVQMIVEKEMYGWDDLNDLLHQFLSLNSPRHHHVILRAFADLWSGIFSPPSPLAGADHHSEP